jgi:hypothetical protein
MTTLTEGHSSLARSGPFDHSRGKKPGGGDMTTVGRTDSGNLRPVAAAVATAALVGAIVFVLGGESYLTSPAIWGTVAWVAVILVVAGLARHRPLRLLVALPVVVGGALAVVAGAWDYLPWLTSPLLWLGALGSGATGLWLVRSGRATGRDIVVGFVLGLVVFGLGLLAVFAGIVFISVAWNPFGTV